MTIEYARTVLGLKTAHSTEMAPDTDCPVVLSLSECKNVTQLGGTMRLGSYPCLVEKQTRCHEIYKKDLIQERHRHRYEVNQDYTESLERSGLKISGRHPETGLTEMVEISEHPWYIGVQFHPEFQSKAFAPHPLFYSFIQAALEHSRSKIECGATTT
jgi:CTP synthase